MTDEAGTTTYGYDAVGSRASLNYANGTRTSYAYDPLNRLLELSHFDATDTLGANGNRLQHAELNGRTVDYTYDDLYRLLTETVTDPTLGNRSASWTYDAVGNRLTQVETDTSGTTTTTYVYDNNDRLTSETATGSSPSATSYTYDANGNTLTRTADGVTTTYAYDSRNRLTNLNAGQVTYRYDANGIRMSEMAAGLTTNYLVDPNRDYAQVIEESFDLNTFADVRYTYGDDLIAQHRRTGPSTTESRTFHYDGLGSTRLLTDTTGATTDTYAFTAFGELEDSTGITQNDYLYTGEQYDPNLGFYYLRARYYNPAIGRFPTMDTWLGTLVEPISQNKYVYANAEPSLGIDPSGNSTIAEMGAVLNVSAVLASFAKALVTVCAAEFATTSIVATPANSPTIGCRSRLHRGRIQAQGGGYEDSESWARATPPTAAEGVIILERLVQRMPRRESRIRDVAANSAEVWILARPPAGVYAPLSKSWTNPGVRGSVGRIDIEIIEGRAFLR